MTVGLAVASGSRIFLAIESHGLPHPLESKIVDLRGHPDAAVLAAGGLDHWYCVRREYKQQANLLSACRKIVGLLNTYMTSENEAHGLLCGFDGGRPVCYRIDRFEHWSAATYREEAVAVVQIIGREYLASKARELAEVENMAGVDWTRAFKETIESLGPVDGYIRMPVCSRTLEEA
jgi:hypothetical protein